MRQIWSWIRTTGQVLWDVWMLSADIHLGLIAAGVAFFGIFAVFPAIAALIAIFGLVADPSIVDTQLALLDEIIPEEAYALLDEQINRLLTTQSDTLGWTTVLSVGVALWSTRAGVGALVEGLNAIHGRPNRTGISHAIVAMTLTLALIAIAVAALLVVVVTPILMTLVPVNAPTGLLLEAIRWMVALVILLAALGLLYRFGPSRGQRRMKWVTPGALLVVVCWLLASYGFSLYLTNFGSYNEVYGSIGAVIALLMWLYISAYLVLMGAALNVVLHLEEGPYKRA